MLCQEADRLDSLRLLAIMSLAVLIGTACDGTPEESAEANPADPPNILLIVADDLGYTDLGSFGGEIATPNLDRLAYRGTRLTSFHTASSCAPTRAMLMTGTDHHLAGVGSQANLETEAQAQHRQYRNRLLPEVPTIAEHLGAQGYRTYASAKWHIGMEPEELPGARGFDRSFVLLQGGGGHFDRTPLFEGRRNDWLEDDRPAELPGNFYSTDAMTDRMIEYIRSSDGRPFFAYLAYTAPHWPLQAPEEAIEVYADKYGAGWDQLRQERMAGAIRAGLHPAGTPAVDHEPGMVPWSGLSAGEQTGWSRRMAVYAAMIHRLDENVGRLLTVLERDGLLENTVIVFMADNGAEGHDMEAAANREGWLDRVFDNSPANIGSRTSYTSIGAGWARAVAAPFRDSKSKIAEGGIRVPAFIVLPEGRGGISNAYMRAMDLPPTFLHLATGSEAAGRATAMMGRSVLAHLEGGPDPYSRREAVAYEVYGRLAVQKGKWKALRQEPPFGSGEWQLYDLNTDLGEQQDYAQERPEVLEELIADWEAYAEAVGVVLPEHPIRY